MICTSFLAVQPGVVQCIDLLPSSVQVASLSIVYSVSHTWAVVVSPTSKVSPLTVISFPVLLVISTFSGTVITASSATFLNVILSPDFNAWIAFSTAVFPTTNLVSPPEVVVACISLFTIFSAIFDEKLPPVTSTTFPASDHSFSVLSALLNEYALTASTSAAELKTPFSILTVSNFLYPSRFTIDTAAPSAMGPSASVFSWGWPVTVIAVSPTIVRLPEQTCTPACLALITELSIVTLPDDGK